ncbi:putative zinc finger CCCH domain-containing protein 21 [Rosa rugosa]|uniref:putative zinc finger CCCH domain-containing protein 21 n=1 Tax=Rosa rugosa TaxID=74645 RepID=UPI002B40799E|nr:putative zinc finger CCCH domain-containing protein 21 [Rosa rugosa]
MKETNVVPANSTKTNVVPANSMETNVVPGISTETNVIPATTETNIFSSINNIGFSFHNTQPSRSLQSINVVWSSSVMANLAVSQLEPAEEKQGTTEENPEEQGNPPAYRWWADRDYLGNKYTQIGNGDSYSRVPRVLELSYPVAVSRYALAPDFVPSSSTACDQHQHQPPKRPSPLYKTVLCRYKSSCSKGDGCNFAHTLHEIRRTPMYDGDCKFGSRCPYGRNCFYRH